MEAPILYLFNRSSDGQWIFGKNTDCEVAAGQFRLVPSEDRTTVDVYQYKLKRCLYYRVPVINFKNESGDSYATFNDLKAAYLGFAQQGSLLNPLNVLIKSLNPIFWIEDMTKVVDGKFVDKSGNNKQIAAAQTILANDSVIMPANDTQIIDKFKEIGVYSYFYTDDSTPKKIAICNIEANYNKYLFSTNNVKNFALTSSPISADFFGKIGQVNYNDLYTTNLAKQFNYNIVTKTAHIDSLISLFYNSQNVASIEDNSYSFSVSKKTLVCPISTTNATELVVSFYFNNYGWFSGGMWVNRTELVDRHFQIQFDTTESTNDNLIRAPWLNPSNNWAIVGSESTGTGFLRSMKISAIVGDWSYVEFKAFIPRRNNQSWIYNTSLRVRLTGGTAVIKNIHIVDLTVVNADISIDRSFNYPSFYETDQKYLGKSICYVGDSISVNTYADIAAQRLGFKTIHSYAKSGTGMTFKGVNASWQPYYKEAQASLNADVYLIMLGVNDRQYPIGEEGSTDNETYTGAYDNYISYMKTALPSAKFVLITPPITTATPTGAIFDMIADRIKFIGNKYGCPVCDLHSLTSITLANANIFISDGTHWDTSAHRMHANIVAKFLKELPT